MRTNETLFWVLVYLFIYLSVYLFTHWLINWLTDLFIYLFVYLSVYLLIYTSTFQSISHMWLRQYLRKIILHNSELSIFMFFLQSCTMQKIYWEHSSAHFFQSLLFLCKWFCACYLMEEERYDSTSNFRCSLVLLEYSGLSRGLKLFNRLFLLKNWKVIFQTKY